MVYFLYGLFFLSCFVLIAAVLLQPGKTDAGALFTSNVSSTAFSPRGTATVLSKVTIAAAVTFMLSALMLSMPALKGNVSVLSSNPETTVEEQAASTESNANVEVPTEANITVPGDANNAPAETNANTMIIGDAPANANSEPPPND